MASLVKDLIQILEEETGCYRLLLTMADNKKDVIINGDLPGLQVLTKEEQEMAGLLLRLEKQRAKIIEDIALVTNQNNEAMTVHKLIALLEGQEEQSYLQQVSDDLVEVVVPLQAANKQNQELLKQSLEFVDFTMNAIHSSRQPVVTNNYQSKGKAYGEKYSGGKNFFDTKQ